MKRARIGRALLALCGHRAGEARDLSGSDWLALDAMADQHRLQPMLHGRRVRGEIGGIPDALASRWQGAHRANAIAMLAQRRALLQAVETLAAHGIETVALKGAALAWTVWPSPAERVMRDIDLLVAENAAARAYELLRASGWVGPDLCPADSAAFSTDETHFPPLMSGEGVMAELHAHSWGRPPLPGTTMPRRDDAGLLACARHNEALGAAVPSSEYMLAHLVVHAACSHLLNVGPMALVDIDMWCTKRDIAWPLFWKRAERDGFARSAALLFALVDRWRRPGFCAASQCRHEVEPDLLEEAELLLVQDLDARKDVSVIASLSQGRLGGRVASHPLDRAGAEARAGERLSHLLGRARSLGSSVLSPETRRDGLATARLQNWIAG